MRIEHIGEEEFLAEARPLKGQGSRPSPETAAVMKALQTADTIKLTFEYEYETQNLYNRLRMYFRTNHLKYYVAKRGQCLYVGKLDD